MLFEKIGLIDENFDYRENMYVGVSGERIVYIGSDEPEPEIKDNLGKL